MGILVAYFLFDLEFGNNFQIILLSLLMQFLAKMGGHGHGHGHGHGQVQLCREIKGWFGNS